MNDTAKRLREKGINLIDRDFLLFELEKLQSVPKWAMMAVTEIIDEMPKEYPPEGYWMKGETENGVDWLICSDCGSYSAVDYEYCPYCGTRMVKDENKTM